MSTLLDRLRAKIGPPTGARGCRLWTAGVSRGGMREVDYGNIQEGRRGSRMWRAHRLVLLLKTAPTDCPRDDGEALDAWLKRAARCYDHLEASHTCDVSLCCNEDHLEWQDHGTNVRQQAGRRRSGRRAMRAIAALLVGAVLLFGASARADEPATASAPLEHASTVFDRLAPASYITLVGGNAADLWATARVIRSGVGQEANPLLGRELGRIIATKAITVGLTALAMRFCSTHGQPKLAAIFGFASGAVGVGAAVHNSTLIH